MSAHLTYLGVSTDSGKVIGRRTIPVTALITTVTDRVVCVEPNGFQGFRREVLRPCSLGGDALSVYWNVNHTNRTPSYVARFAGSGLIAFVPA